MSEKTIKLQGGGKYKVTDSEAKKIVESRDDIVYVSRLDVYLNKKYIVSIDKSQLSNYKQL